jgi:hypothetical protein
LHGTKILQYCFWPHAVLKFFRGGMVRYKTTNVEPTKRDEWKAHAVLVLPPNDC